MHPQLEVSLFQDILFPDAKESHISNDSDLILSRLLRFCPEIGEKFLDIPTVIFDFETTGLDSAEDRIIEIGAIKYKNFRPVDEISTLVKPDVAMNEASIKLTGITEDMLADQPPIEDVLETFLQFINGSILFAHNAEFDLGFLKAACKRQGYELNWPCFCTLKLARQFLPDLESKNLDSLSRHYGLEFEARHRSIGDVKVTGAVLERILKSEPRALRRLEILKVFWCLDLCA